jgi:hypothetical protein
MEAKTTLDNSPTPMLLGLRLGLPESDLFPVAAIVSDPAFLSGTAM